MPRRLIDGCLTHSSPLSCIADASMISNAVPSSPFQRNHRSINDFYCLTSLDRISSLALIAPLKILTKKKSQNRRHRCALAASAVQVPKNVVAGTCQRSRILIYLCVLKATLVLSISDLIKRMHLQKHINLGSSFISYEM